MEIGERVCLRSVRGGMGTTAEKALGLGKMKDLSRALGAGRQTEPEEEKEGFEIMANVVWAEFGRSIIDEMGGVVFAAGRPDEFRKVRL